MTDDFDHLVRDLSPLIDSYQVTSDASMRVQVNSAAWNSFTHDQQQELCDEIASKSAVQSMRKTLHLYVHHTEVGAIGPGWTGEWKFRRE